MKRIAIVGGGISGLAVLHYLKQRCGEAVDITLFEREPCVGGTIRSFKKEACLFEWGPNGFLDNHATTTELIEALGLKETRIEASSDARARYIQIEGRLQAIPRGLKDFIQTPLLPTADKWALVLGFFKKHISKDCSIKDYVSRRFSARIAASLIDPMMSGIYAGDIQRLHMASAFPKMRPRGLQKSRMCSFKGGMAEIIQALQTRYKKHIQISSDVVWGQVNADIVICATAAYDAARFVEALNPHLSQTLASIAYAPVAVVGLVFKENAFKRKPDGFGYLIPSSANKDVLGVLIESNVYAARAREGAVMMRVLLGGRHHPEIVEVPQEQIVAKAIRELDSIYGLNTDALEIFFKLWPRAIPQYEMGYPAWREAVRKECVKIEGLYLCANYLDGISFNDCIDNAKHVAQAIRI